MYVCMCEYVVCCFWSGLNELNESNGLDGLDELNRLKPMPPVSDATNRGYVWYGEYGKFGEGRALSTKPSLRAAVNSLQIICCGCTAASVQ